MDELIEVSRVIATGTTAKLLAWAEERGCVPSGVDKYELEYANDFEHLARHYYPSRDKLIDACLNYAIAKAEAQS